MRKVKKERLEILKREWDINRNIGIQFDEVKYGSKKKFWWLCSKGHSYQAQMEHRTRKIGSGCPYCAGNRVTKENSLATLFPELAKEWHPTRNSNLTPYNVSKGSNKKVWWVCKKGHEYEARVYSRTSGRKCPYCLGKKVNLENCLGTVCSDLSKEWHPTKNNNLTPLDVTKGSNKKVWWLCSSGHQYKATIYDRAKRNGAGCPYCSGKRVSEENCLAALFPELVKEWHPTKNKDLTPNDVTKGSKKRVWWQCPRGHSYETKINDKTSHLTGCPKCSGQTSRNELRIYSEMKKIFSDVCSRHKINKNEIDIFIKEFNIGIEYDGEYFHKGRDKKDLNKNKALSKHGVCLIRVREIPLKKLSDDDILVSSKLLKKDDINRLLLILKNKISQKSIVFKIKEYIKQSKFQNTNEYQKLLSYYPRPVYEKSLAHTHPGLAKEWDSLKNFPLEPSSYTSGSSISVWWKCSNNHLFKAVIGGRANGRGCPYCSGNRVSKENSLAAQRPDLIHEWHPKKNKDKTPYDVSKGSNKKIWWLCDKGHEFQAIVSSRTKEDGTGCPYCSGNRVNEENSLAALFPELSNEWHPTKNKDITPYDVSKGSNKKIWWLCDKGHEFESIVKSRAKHNGTGCPYCAGKKANNENCLGTIYPDLSKEWHPTKNKDLTPINVVAGSRRKVWWVCKKGHEYEACVFSRAKKNGTECPYCSGRKASPENNLQTLHPDIASDWDYKRNSLTPSMFVPGSHKKVWWVCSNGHEYTKEIRQKVKSPKCPHCSGKDS